LIRHIKLRLEQRPAGFETHRVDVGDVVADDVEASLVDVKPGKPSEQRAGQCHIASFNDRNEPDQIRVAAQTPPARRATSAILTAFSSNHAACEFPQSLLSNPRAATQQPRGETFLSNILRHNATPGAHFGFGLFAWRASGFRTKMGSNGNFLFFQQLITSPFKFTASPAPTRMTHHRHRQSHHRLSRQRRRRDEFSALGNPG
jgi:hypothetical protein